MDQAEETHAQATEHPDARVSVGAAEPPEARHKEPSQSEMAQMIADRLGETDDQAVTQIRHLVWNLGRTQALALCEETLQIEERGGLMLPDGSRRRTPGGVFFFLAKTKGQKKERPWLNKAKKAVPEEDEAKGRKPPQPVGKLPSSPPQPAFTWEDRLTVLHELEVEKGTARTVNITLIGRTGQLVDKGSCIVTVMQASRVPALPKGLPVPPAVTTNYVVYIAAKQWKTVSEALADPEDTLIVEGFPQIDTKTGSIAVFATNTTTKKRQAARREPPATSQST